MNDVLAIDLTPYYRADEAAKREVAAAIDRACRSIGFLTVTGHRVPQSLIDDTIAIADAFFDLPPDEKLRCSPAEGVVLRGYSPMATQTLARSKGEETPPDLRESFMLGRPHLTGAEYADRPSAAVFYQPNLWPARPERFRQVLTAYFGAMEDLARDLMRLFALALSLPETWFDDKIDDHFSALGTMFYPPLLARPAHRQLRAGAHTDFGSLTILAQTEAAGGLEVKSPGGDWVLIAPRRGTFVVNIGDLMQQWTNDRWQSTLHRVANPPDELAATARRQSLGFFCHPNFDAMVECLPGCREPGAPAHYAPIRAGDYMRRKILAVRHIDAKPVDA